MGSLYLICGVAGIIFDSGIFLKYGFTALGVFYYGFYFYKLKFQYLELEDQILTCNIPGNKKEIDLTKVTRIKKIADEITFLTLHEKLVIRTDLIAREDLPVLKDALASLELEPIKNPFKKEIIKTI